MELLSGQNFEDMGDARCRFKGATCDSDDGGTQITCFTGTKVQILTQKKVLALWQGA